MSNMIAHMQIRGATPADADVIVAFNQRMAEETESKRLPPNVLRAGVTAALEDPRLGRYFLACRSDAVIGQLMLTTEWSDWRNGHIWWIQSVYVRPDERRRGVYRALHDHVRTLAEQTSGVVGIRLYVERHNTIAQQTYRQLGMTDAGYIVFEQMFSQ
jgi:ribosomal protein S18 acetylase RimI-like enzyme